MANTQIDGLIQQRRSRISDFLNSRQDLREITPEEAAAILHNSDPEFRQLEASIRAAARSPGGKPDVGVGKMSPILKALGAPPDASLASACAAARSRLVSEARQRDPSLTRAVASAKVSKSAPGSALYALEHCPTAHLPAGEAITKLREIWPDYADEFARRIADL